MFGSVVGSFGTSTRYADNASAVNSKGRAPSRGGTAPWPGTRTTFGSQNSGCAVAKAERSSMGAPMTRGRLKDLASVEQTLYESALDFLRLEGRRWPESNHEAFLLGFNGVNGL